MNLNKLADLIQTRSGCERQHAEAHARRLAATDAPITYSPWRHGGWYTSVQYLDGACGCVSRNYDDRKWRIVCDPRPDGHEHTYRDREAAARAEQALALAEYTDERMDAEIAAERERMAEIQANRARQEDDDDDQDEPEATPSDADRCSKCDVVSPPGALRCIACGEPLDH